MTQSIIALNQRYLTDSRLPIPDRHSRDCRMLAHFCESCAQDRVLQVGLMPRAGANNLPFDNRFTRLTNQVMPEYDARFDLTWEQVTDLRAQELLSMVRQKHKRLYVQWSGGIDSTCIVVALLKNFPPADREQITICLTYDSILEYSWFYLKHIVPNFRVQDLNLEPLLLHQLDNALLVDGQTADCLTMSMAPSLDVSMAVRDSDLLVENWRSRPDALIAYLAKVTKSQDFSQWYYDTIRENVESVDVPIETYFDFMWWAGFNYDWALQTFCQWFYIQRRPDFSYDKFMQCYMPWYVNSTYQSWALKNVGAWIKHGRTLSSFKQDAKRYCYDYTQDLWNLKHKTKVSSRGRPMSIDLNQPFAITNDFEVLTLNQDLDRILELWPTHIRL